MAEARPPSIGCMTELQDSTERSEVGFTSEDGRFLIRVPREVVASIHAVACAFGPLETGGLLVGRYGARASMLTVATALPPPPDSLHSRNDFVRGTEGVPETVALARAEDPTLYVTGEWHTHPAHAATPSSVDHRHMQRFARRGLYGCPTPTLLIIGGDFGASAPWSATVYRRWRRPCALARAW